MSVIAFGKPIAEKIKSELKEYAQNLERPLRFHILYVGSDPVIDNFISYKKKFGKAIGVNVVIHNIDADIQQEDMITYIRTHQESADGMIVQLPLPKHLNTQIVLDAIPPQKDVDVLSSTTRELFKKGDTPFLPAVTGAIITVLKEHTIELEDKKICLIGNGNLVGTPTAMWLSRQGYSYVIVTEETSDEEKKKQIKESDIIISGAGVRHIITPTMISEGVVIIDAGTTESKKRVLGDMHPDCIPLTSLYTPVPGGIGPITIAILYQNLIQAHASFCHE